MKIEQIYTGCLSQGTYYIESNGEVAIIDPLREIDTYLKLAKENNAKIKYIFETHIHADFVSGHLTLSNATGAPIIFGPNTITSYPVTIAEDQQVFKLGNLTFVALHTPGHTLESTTYLLKDNVGNAASINGATQIRAGVIRPEIVIPLESSNAENDSESKMPEGIQEGSTVRVIRSPNFGKIGTVTSLPSELNKMESETMVRVAEIKIDGTNFLIPRANLEMVEMDE